MIIIDTPKSTVHKFIVTTKIKLNLLSTKTLHTINQNKTASYVSPDSKTMIRSAVVSRWPAVS